jgi:hypothetical protein
MDPSFLLLSLCLISLEQWGRRIEGWPNTAGVILYMMDGPYCLLLLYRTGCPNMSCPTASWWNGISIYSKSTQPSVMSYVTQGRHDLVLYKTYLCLLSGSISREQWYRRLEGLRNKTARLAGWRRVTQQGVILWWWTAHATYPDGPYRLPRSEAAQQRAASSSSCCCCCLSIPKFT